MNHIVLIYDYCGAGNYIFDIIVLIKELKRQGIVVSVVDWESFEYYLLNINFIYKEISELITEDVVIENLNEEKYYEDLLKKVIVYDKKNLDKTCFSKTLCGGCQKRDICSVKSLKIRKNIVYGILLQLANTIDNNKTSEMIF